MLTIICECCALVLTYVDVLQICLKLVSVDDRPDVGVGSQRVSDPKATESIDKRVTKFD